MRERTKNRPRTVGVCALILILTAAALWYTRPVSFLELTPGFDRGMVSELSGGYEFRDTVPNGAVNSRFASLELEQGDPLIGELLDLLDSYAYRRSLFGSLLSSTGGGVINNGWYIRTDGRTDGGVWSHFWLDHTTHGMYLRYTTPDGDDMKIYISAVGQKQFDSEVHALLRENTSAE